MVYHPFMVILGMDFLIGFTTLYFTGFFYPRLDMTWRLCKHCPGGRRYKQSCQPTRMSWIHRICAARNLARALGWGATCHFFCFCFPCLGYVSIWIWEDGRWRQNGLTHGPSFLGALSKRAHDCHDLSRTVSGIFLLASLVNHSCQPSAARIFLGDMMFVRAARHMRAGDEAWEPELVH